ncbi:MAG TPA: hypothetical protein VHA52_02260 [Candidatus Babeliaceae bacterium]|nr:hypothetical protein [Candidatus Babeliaceae bacterium]
MGVRNSVQVIPLTSIASSALTADYQSINTEGLANACSIIRITSTSSTDVTISYNGSTDHEYLPAGGTITLPFQANAQPQSYVANMAAGTIVYVKGAAGTGNIYLSGYYTFQGI